LLPPSINIGRKFLSGYYALVLWIGSDASLDCTKCGQPEQLMIISMVTDVL